MKNLLTSRIFLGCLSCAIVLGGLVAGGLYFRTGSSAETPQVIKTTTTSTKRNFADEIYWASADLVIRWGLWISFAVLNLWLYSNGNLSVVGIVTAVTVLQQFTNSIWEISGRIQHIATDFSEYKQNYNYLFPGRNVVKEYYQDLNKPKLKVQKLIFDSSISFNNLNFAYPDRDDTKVLKNINLTINKNEKVGIVGKSGSGKTTLIKLLLGFYDYEDGAIQVDGKPLKKESLITRRMIIFWIISNQLLSMMQKVICD